MKLQIKNSVIFINDKHFTEVDDDDIREEMKKYMGNIYGLIGFYSKSKDDERSEILLDILKCNDYKIGMNNFLDNKLL